MQCSPPPPIYGAVTWGSAATPNLLGPPLGTVLSCPLPKLWGTAVGLRPSQIFWGHWLQGFPSPNLWGRHLGVCSHPTSFGATVGHCVVVPPPIYGAVSWGSAATPNLVGPPLGAWLSTPPPNLWGHHLRSAVTTWAHPDLGSHQYRSPLQLLNTNIGSPPLLWFPPSPPPPNSVPSNIEPPSPPHFMVPTNIGPPCNR